jgi:hypothetical protein
MQLRRGHLVEEVLVAMSETMEVPVLEVLDRAHSAVAMGVILEVVVEIQALETLLEMAVLAVVEAVEVLALIMLEMAV